MCFITLLLLTRIYLMFSYLPDLTYLARAYLPTDHFENNNVRQILQISPHQHFRKKSSFISLFQASSNPTIAQSVKNK